MKNELFVLDAHTGFWDASKENCKNRFGDAFIETFYAFHTGFNPPEKRWTMDYESQFRKVDPEWYLEEVFIKGDADMSILSTQVLMDFYPPRSALSPWVAWIRGCPMPSTRWHARSLTMGCWASNGTPPSGAVSRADGVPMIPWSSPSMKSAWNWASRICTSIKVLPSSRSRSPNLMCATSTNRPGSTPN